MTYEGYSEFKNWTPDQFGKLTSTDADYYSDEVGPYLQQLATHPVNLLEVGFGNGSFMQWAREQGINVIGSEIQLDLCGHAEKAGFSTVQDLSSLGRESLDICVAFDVIEHIEFEHLITMCRQLHSALKPGGFFIARFPNGDSPFALINQNADPTHVQFIGQKKIKLILDRSGFDLLELRAQRDAPRSVLKKVKLGVKKALRFFYRSFVKAAFLGGSTPSTFEVNYVVIAAKR